MLTYKMAIALRPQICDVTSPYVFTFHVQITHKFTYRPRVNTETGSLNNAQSDTRCRRMTVRHADARVTCQTLQLTFYNYNYNRYLYCARFIFFPMKTPATFHFVLFCSFMSLVFRNVLSSFSFLLAKNHWIHGVITMTSEMLQKYTVSTTHHRPIYASNISTCLPTSCQ